MRIFEYRYEDISELVEQFCPHVIGVHSNLSPPTAERFESTPVEGLQSEGYQFATSMDSSSGDIIAGEGHAIVPSISPRRVSVPNVQLGSPFNGRNRERSWPKQGSIRTPGPESLNQMFLTPPRTRSLDLAVKSPQPTSIPLSELSTPSTCGSRNSELLTPSNDIALRQHDSVKFSQDEYV